MRTGIKNLICMLSVIIAVAVSLTIAVQVNRVMDYPDFNAYWLSGKLINMGFSPYDQTAWEKYIHLIVWPKDQASLYPLPTSIFFSLWSHLELRFSYTLWMFGSLLCIISAIAITLGLWQDHKGLRFLPFVIAGLGIYRPLIVTIRNGQMGGIILILLAIVFLLWSKNRWVEGGIIASLMLLKPSLSAPFLVMIACYFLWKKNWKVLIGLCTGVLLFLIIGWFYNIDWVSDYLRVGAQKINQTFGYSPTLWGLAHNFCARDISCSTILGTLSCFVLGGGILFWFVKWRPCWQDALIVFVSASLLVTPYIWAYDHVMLIVPIVWIMGRLNLKNHTLLTALYPSLLSISALLLFFVASIFAHDAFSSFIPFAVLVSGMFASPKFDAA